MPIVPSLKNELNTNDITSILSNGFNTVQNMPRTERLYWFLMFLPTRETKTTIDFLNCNSLARTLFFENLNCCIICYLVWSKSNSFYHHFLQLYKLYTKIPYKSTNHNAKYTLTDKGNSMRFVVT